MAGAPRKEQEGTWAERELGSGGPGKQRQAEVGVGGREQPGVGPAGKLKGTEPLAGDLRDVPSLIWTMEVKSHPCLRGVRAERGSSKRLLPGRRLSLCQSLLWVTPPGPRTIALWGWVLSPSSRGGHRGRQQPETRQGAGTPAQAGPSEGCPLGLCPCPEPGR